MDILHLLRSEPDVATEKLISDLSADGRVSIIKLFHGDIDWEGVIEAIYSHTRVVCWW
jgi:hypothetical protein